jgi:endonuclease-8
VPEGDTIHRTAGRLRAVLGTGPVEAFDAPGVPGPRPELGERIDAVEALGKHLLLRFSGGAILHTHLGMQGAWRVVPSAAGAEQGDPQRPIQGRGVARLATPSAVATCRRATVELLDEPGLRRHPWLRALGPDLCRPEVDLAAILRRLDALDPSTPLGDALLDQRPASGVGNVYRSEALWACGLDPFVALRDVPASDRRRLWSTASELLRRNLAGGPRRTVPQGLAVYDRAGRACRRCGTPIRVRRTGERARATWWCPTCQTAPGTAGPPGGRRGGAERDG